MKWVNYTKIYKGQRIFGLDTKGKVFLSKGLTINSIKPDCIIVRHDYGETEKVNLDTKFYIKEK